MELCILKKTSCFNDFSEDRRVFFSAMSVTSTLPPDIIDWDFYLTLQSESCCECRMCTMETYWADKRLFVIDILYVFEVSYALWCYDSGAEHLVTHQSPDLRISGLESVSKRG
uniref:Uncharacterized protein n=1 Tax=Anguilla anguilla TaxID=7936 RepID=A0A0E9WUJ8_ANGAN